MMHWAVTHQTAAEIVYSRADAKMPHMGLTTWKNAPDGRVQKSDTIVAKNYLSDKEASALNHLSTVVLNQAEFVVFSVCFFFRLFCGNSSSIIQGVIFV